MTEGDGPHQTKGAYRELCKGACFLASKAVTSGNDLDTLARIKTALEADYGAYLGAGSSRNLLQKGFVEGKPLGAGMIVLNEVLGLHHGGLEKWKATYVEYGTLTNYGHLILAGTIENFASWAKSKPCRDETARVVAGRLFAYIRHPVNEKFTHPGRGFIVYVDAHGNKASATVSDGYGYVLWQSGDYFEGELKGGLKHGQGTETWASGDKYVGEWKDNKRNGQGTQTYASGDKYVGEFKDNKMHGQGTYTYADGNKYVGEWKDSKMHGQGTYTSASGDKYVGEWKDGDMHGQGTKTFANDGTVQKGKWEHNTFLG